MENVFFVLILRYVEFIFLLSLEDAAELKPLEIKVSILVQEKNISEKIHRNRFFYLDFSKLKI